MMHLTRCKFNNQSGVNIMLRVTYLKGRTFRQWIENTPIQMKLIFTYIMVILIPTIFFTSYILNVYHRNTIKEVVSKSQHTLNIEKTNIQNNMEQMERIAQLGLSDNGLMNYLQVTRDLETEELVNFNSNTYYNLQRILFSSPSISSMRIFYNNKFSREIWPLLLNESRIKDETWYRDVLAQNGIVWWNIYKGPKDIVKDNTAEMRETQVYVSLLREIKNASNNSIGILQVNMQLDQFFSNINGFVHAEDSQMLVIDRYLRAYNNESSDFYNKLPVEEIIRQYKENKEKGLTSYQFNYKKIPYLCVFSEVDRLGSGVIIVTSLEKSFNDIYRTRFALVAASLFLVALLSLITYQLLSFILKRLHILRDKMKRVRQGDINVDFPEMGYDEVGELAHHIRLMLKKINALIVLAVNKEASTKEAELRSLRNQIDAHFLYNTLENLKMLAEIEGHYLLSDALTSLGGMMRYNLHWSNNHVQLMDEVTHISNYIAVMNLRYENKIKVEYQVPQRLMQQELLKMTLQPIVENAVKYGMSDVNKMLDGIRIWIKAYEQSESIMIEVTDNGVGIPPERVIEINNVFNSDRELSHLQSDSTLPLLTNNGTGIGLRNVNQRIMMNYGKEYGLFIESEAGNFTRIRMKLPYLILSGGQPEHAQFINR